jgi:rhodanese-related sulfurtransferase
MSSFFGLGLFQLESLIQARPSFSFFDIRIRPQIVGIPQVQAVLDQAQVARRELLLTNLKNQKARKEDPIILLCEDGRLSLSAAEELEREGFSQVYVVDGGLDALLREASSG